MSEPLLSVRGLTKTFGGLVAVDNVSFDVAGGEVVGLLGDNGAGKSTLIKCVSGVHAAEDGEIVFDRERVQFTSPMDARRAGIETIYQDLALANNLDVGANIFLGREVKRRRLGGLIQTLDDTHMREQSRQTLEFAADPLSQHDCTDREAIGWPAPGGCDRASGLLGRPAHDHGRTDQQSRRARAAQGAGAHTHA